MKLSVRHRTHYGYSASASQSLNQICLLPRNTKIQTCLQTSVSVTPRPDTIYRRADQYGNALAAFNLHSIHHECDIVVTSLIETRDTLPELPVSESAPDNLATIDKQFSSDGLMARDCLLSSPSIPLDHTVDVIIDELPIGTTPVLEYASMLMSHIFHTFTYESGFSTLITPLSKIISARKGVCQDFAHIWPLQCCAGNRYRLDMSAGILKHCLHRDRPNYRVQTHRTPGMRCTLPSMAGLILTRPITNDPIRNT